MRWKGRRESENVEDRRGRSGGFGFPGGGGGFPFPRGRMPMPGRRSGGIGVVGLLMLLGVMLLLGVDPRVLLQGGGPVPDARSPESPRQIPFPGQPAPAPAPRQQQTASPDDEMKRFISVVLADTEDVWNNIFASQNQKYREPQLVLFRQATQSGCGIGVSQMGPFYCPLDGKLYVDLAFYEELKSRFRAPGDFAQAYVIAHEVGHHVQNLLGIAERVQQVKADIPEAEANAIQVRMELQADCLAGLWAHHTQRINKSLEPGDIEEALRAATAIGDDTIQRRAQGRIVPDSFTHGTSEQRVRWFKRGFETGRFGACDTFSANEL